MARPLNKDIPKIIAAVVVIWLVFFYRVGNGTRSFAGHLYRIVTTPEAEELGHEVLTDVRDAASAVTRRVRGAIVGYP